MQAYSSLTLLVLYQQQMIVFFGAKYNIVQNGDRPLALWARLFSGEEMA